VTINYEIKLTTLKLLGICRNNGSDFRETFHVTINYEIKLTTLKLLGICRNNGSDAFLSNQTQVERNTQTT